MAKPPIARRLLWHELESQAGCNSVRALEVLSPPYGVVARSLYNPTNNKHALRAAASEGAQVRHLLRHALREPGGRAEPSSKTRLRGSGRWINNITPPGSHDLNSRWSMRLSLILPEHRDVPPPITTKRNGGVCPRDQLITAMGKPTVLTDSTSTPHRNGLLHGRRRPAAHG